MKKTVILGVLTGMFITSSVVGEIINTTGDVVKVPRPKSIMIGDYESNTDIWAFVETDNFKLPIDVQVDISESGYYGNQLTPSILPAGTVIDSYYLHHDPVRGEHTRVKGSITFDTEILGLIVADETFTASDFFTEGSTRYATGQVARGIEVTSSQDWIELSSDRRTMTLMMVAGFPGDQIRIFTKPSKSLCRLYGVHDGGLSDSQFFSLSAENFEITPMGSLKKAHDIEALDIHPQTAQLFAAAGRDTNKPGYLYTVDKKNGELTEIGYTGFKEIDGLSFSPEGVLWGWATDNGLVTIDTKSGEATLIVEYPAEIEDLTWNTDGSILYLIENIIDGRFDKGTKLLAYNTVTGDLSVICEKQMPDQEIEALDTLPDDSLIFGIHGKNRLLLGGINPETCEIIASQNIVTDYNDVEGIAWPNCQ